MSAQPSFPGRPVIVVTRRERNPALDDVPTAIESGLAGFEMVGFHGVLVAAGTPAPVVATPSQAFGRVLGTPEVRDRRVAQGADPAFLDAAAVRASGAQLD